MFRKVKLGLYLYPEYIEKFLCVFKNNAGYSTFAVV